MSDASIPRFTVEVNRIEQKMVRCEREYGTVATTSVGEALIQFQLEEVDGEEFSRDISCHVQLSNATGETLFNAVSEYRVGHEVEIEGDFSTEAVFDTLSELALRVSYPYHRAAISNAVLMSGLPPFFLPLAADSDWIRVVKEAKSPATEDHEH